MRHLPELDMIQAFVAVAEERSFRRAARRLNLDQSAVSRRIQALEARLEAPLLTRSTRAVALTPAGEAFFEENRPLLRLLERSVDAARRAAAGERGRIRIATMSFAALSAMPRAVAGFRARHPGVGVGLTYMSTEAQKTALARGTIDAGFLIGPFAQEGCEALTLAEERLVALLPARHPLARRRRVALAELAAAGLVLGAAEEWDVFRALLGGLFAAEGVTMAPALEPTDTLGILGLVAAGLGVTLYPEGIRRLRPEGVVLRPLAEPGPPIRTVLAWRSGAGPALGHFVEACRALR
jgi:DNA-binding transcriptional LysR family regulator